MDQAQLDNLVATFESAVLAKASTQAAADITATALATATQQADAARQNYPAAYQALLGSEQQIDAQVTGQGTFDLAGFQALDATYGDAALLVQSTAATKAQAAGDDAITQAAFTDARNIYDAAKAALLAFINAN